MPGGRLIERIYDVVHDYRRGEKNNSSFGIIISLIVQSLNIFCFYVIGTNLHYEITMGALFFIVPLGLIAMASVPLSPVEWGVGQYVFFGSVYLGTDLREIWGLL